MSTTVSTEAATIPSVKTLEELQDFARERKEDARTCRELAEFFRQAANINDSASRDSLALSKLVEEYSETIGGDGDQMVRRYYESMRGIRAGTRFFARLERWGHDLIEWMNTHSNGPVPEMPASPMPKNTGVLG